MSTNFRISHAERNFSAALRQYHPEHDAATDKFRSLFADLSRECSPTHIQACSDWIIDNVLRTPALVDALGGFITSISAAYSAEKQKKDGMSKMEIKAKIWPLTFVINELLHSTKYHMRDRQQYDEHIIALRLPVINLIKDLSQFRRSAHPKHFKRVLALLAFWHKQGYFDRKYLASLKVLVDSEGQQLPAEMRDLVSGKQKRANDEADAPRKRKKLDPTKGIQVLGGINNVGEDGDWKLPEWHGGENTPWHLLPAASWLRPLQITDHDRGRGMRRSDFRALSFKGDPVSRRVRKEVMKLLKEANDIYNPGPDSGKRIEYDQMGRKLEVVKVRKNADGKVKKYIKYDTYYGWSSEFLDEMYRSPDKGFLAAMRKPKSRSPSMSSSPPPRRRSVSPTRARVPHVQPSFQQHRPPPASPAQGYPHPPPPPPPPPSHAHVAGFPPPPPPQYAQQQNFQQPPSAPPWAHGGQSSFPPPPNVPWGNVPLPLPPPPPPHMMGQTPFSSLPPPPPPPPPPPHMHGYQNQGGYRGNQGSNGWRNDQGGRGRGAGYGRGGY